MMTLIRTATLSIGAAAILALAGCSSTTKQPSQSTTGGSTSTAPSGTTAKIEDKALVRFVNATPAPKDLYFGDMNAFSNVAPMAASAYSELPADRHDFKLYSAGNDTGDPLASNSEGPTAGKHYTIVAVNGTDGKAMLNPISDDLAQPDPGKAKVRVIHAAPGVDKVDVYPVGAKDALIGGVAFKDATGYKEVDPVLTEIDVRSDGSKTSVLRVRNLNLAPGKLYTLVVMGGNGQPLTSNVIEDQLLPSVASVQ
jgi:hypothetical protein